MTQMTAVYDFTSTHTDPKTGLGTPMRGKVQVSGGTKELAFAAAQKLLNHFAKVREVHPTYKAEAFGIWPKSEYGHVRQQEAKAAEKMRAAEHEAARNKTIERLDDAIAAGAI
jgi:hypothetical protein